jgi:hypothetical protein
MSLVAAADDGETAMIIMSLRQKLKAQTDEVVQLLSKLSSLVNEHKSEVSAQSKRRRQGHNSSVKQALTMRRKTH